MSTDEEKTRIAMALLDGLADLWWSQSGYPAMELPDRFVKMVKAAYAEGLYNGRRSLVDEPWHVSEAMKFAAWKVLFDGNAVNIIQPSELVGKAIEAALRAA